MLVCPARMGVFFRYANAALLFRMKRFFVLYGLRLCSVWNAFLFHMEYVSAPYQIMLCSVWNAAFSLHSRGVFHLEGFFFVLRWTGLYCTVCDPDFFYANYHCTVLQMWCIPCIIRMLCLES